MNIRTRLTTLIIAVAAIGLFSEAQPQATEAFAQKRESNPPQLRLLCSSSPLLEAETAQVSNRRSARPGDIASGSVLNTPAGELYLNIRPCEGESFIVVFHQPYSRSTRGQKNCGGQTVTIEQIQQN
jgi:hypothetical protein